MGKKYWETDKEKTNLKNEFDDIDDSEDIEDAFLTRKYYDSIVLIVLGDFYSPQGNWCFVTAVYLPLLSVYR